MIFLIYGSDRLRVKTEAELLVSSKKTKYPELTIFRFDTENCRPEQLEEVILGQTLFDKKFIVVLDSLWSLAGELLVGHLSTMATSANLYLLIESGTIPVVIKKIAAVGGKIKEVVVERSSPGRSPTEPNIFAIADAFGERDRKKGWLLLIDFLSRGVATEEIFWKIVWKVKTMLLVQKTPDSATLDLKPFVLNQARRHGQNFSQTELEKLSARLMALWHDNRRGLIDFDHHLERLILEV